MSAMASLQMAGAPLVARRGSAKKASKALRRAMRCNAATAEETEAKLSTDWVGLVRVKVHRPAAS